jgi:acyl-CoA thioesterase-1
MWFFLAVRRAPREFGGETDAVENPDVNHRKKLDESDTASARNRATEAQSPHLGTGGIRICSALLAAACIAAILWELSFRAAPSLKPLKHAELVVIGDSISAGMLGPDRETTWPRHFENRYQVPVVDLSREGATTRSALKQAANIPESATLVLVEIGGNDILGPTTAADFGIHLDALLKAIARPGRQIVMLELPLPPFYNRFGQSQRVLAARYGVALISKRDFAVVLAGKDATIDGLHLSNAGHERLAAMIWTKLASHLTPKGTKE